MAEALRATTTRRSARPRQNACAAAAILRDRKNDFLKAFNTWPSPWSRCWTAPHGLVSQITQPLQQSAGSGNSARRSAFTRNAVGLPSSSLVGRRGVAPLLLERVKALLVRLETNFSLRATDNIGRKLSKKELPDAPLAGAKNLADQQWPGAAGRHRHADREKTWTPSST